MLMTKCDVVSICHVMLNSLPHLEYYFVLDYLPCLLFIFAFIMINDLLSDSSFAMFDLSHHAHLLL